MHYCRIWHFHSFLVSAREILRQSVFSTCHSHSSPNYPSQQLKRPWGILNFSEIDTIILLISHTLLQCDRASPPQEVKSLMNLVWPQTLAWTVRQKLHSGFPWLVCKEPCCFGLLEVFPFRMLTLWTFLPCLRGSSHMWVFQSITKLRTQPTVKIKCHLTVVTQGRAPNWARCQFTEPWKIIINCFKSLKKKENIQIYTMEYFSVIKKKKKKSHHLWHGWTLRALC